MKPTLPAPASPAPEPRQPSPLVTEEDAATFLSVSMRSLQRWRAEERGPPFVKLHERRVHYRLSDLEAWVEARRFASTSAVTTGRVAGR